jgi:excisionase family DNA binding protein
MQKAMERAAFSINEAAVYLGVERAHLYDLMNSGEVPAFHIGKRRLLLRSDLDKFIAFRKSQEPSCRR